MRFTNQVAVFFQMKHLNKKKILQYLYDKLTGSFMGFLIAMAATRLVSQFFETRSIRNLWGLTAKKTLVDKKTFSNLEWMISIIIGFVVFEIMTRYVKELVDKNFPKYKYRLLRWIIKHQLHTKLKTLNLQLHHKRIAYSAAIFQGTKQAFDRFSKR